METSRQSLVTFKRFQINLVNVVKFGDYVATREDDSVIMDIFPTRNAYKVL